MTTKTSQMRQCVEVTGDDLTIDQVLAVAKTNAPVGLSEQVVQKMNNARQILTLAVQRGESVDAAMRRGRVWDKRKVAVGACLKRHGVGSLEQLQLRLVAADRQVKGLDQGDPWDELAAAVAELAA